MYSTYTFFLDSKKKLKTSISSDYLSYFLIGKSVNSNITGIIDKPVIFDIFENCNLSLTAIEGSELIFNGSDNVKVELKLKSKSGIENTNDLSIKSIVICDNNVNISNASDFLDTTLIKDVYIYNGLIDFSDVENLTFLNNTTFHIPKNGKAENLINVPNYRNLNIVYDIIPNIENNEILPEILKNNKKKDKKIKLLIFNKSNFDSTSYYLLLGVLFKQLSINKKVLEEIKDYYKLTDEEFKRLLK